MVSGRRAVEELGWQPTRPHVLTELTTPTAPTELTELTELTGGTRA
ncbi:hypothetical protein [Streptomyces sp. NPDC093089]